MSNLVPLHMQPLVIQTEPLAAVAEKWLAERCRLEQCASDTQQFESLLPEAEAMVIRTYTIVDESMLRRAERLKVVGRAGVGIDNIDLVACRKRGIKVVYRPDANTQAVVEYVFTLLLDAVRPRFRVEQAMDSAQWRQCRDSTVGRRQLNERTLGILGLGRIGGRVAAVARCFGMQVLYYDLAEIPEAHRHGAMLVDPDSLFERADVISIHVDGRPENRGFVDDRFIRSMKPDSILINTSRGFVVDGHALASFLSDYPDARALLDVHETEPIPADAPLLAMPNAVLLPHLAGRTDTAMVNMSWVVKDVFAVLDGREPQHATV